MAESEAQLASLLCKLRLHWWVRFWCGGLRYRTCKSCGKHQALSCCRHHRLPLCFGYNMDWCNGQWRDEPVLPVARLLGEKSCIQQK
jgi:hypothetical protein